MLDLILQAVKNSAVKAFLCECEFAALGVSSQGLTGSSCSSSSEDREKAFLSTVDLFLGGGLGLFSESPLCNLACVLAPYTALLSILAELAVFSCCQENIYFLGYSE